MIDKKKSYYTVSIYFSGNVNITVFAEDEEEAKSIANDAFVYGELDDNVLYNKEIVEMHVD